MFTRAAFRSPYTNGWERVHGAAIGLVSSRGWRGIGPRLGCTLYYRGFDTLTSIRGRGQFTYGFRGRVAASRLALHLRASAAEVGHFTQRR